MTKLERYDFIKRKKKLRYNGREIGVMLGGITRQRVHNIIKEVERAAEKAAKTPNATNKIEVSLKT